MSTLNTFVKASSRALAVIAVLALGVTSSHAADLNPGGVISLNGPVSSVSPFSDDYQFKLTALSSLNFSVSYTDLTPTFSVAITSFLATLYSGLTGTSAPIISGTDGPRFKGLVPNTFFVGSLPSGDYHLTISGETLGSGFDTYQGTLRAAGPVAPIPEPEIWAMMLVGAGLVGLRVRRKSRLDGARHFG